MPTLPLNEFAKAGLNSDLAPWELPQQFATHMNNIRIQDDKLSPLGGQELVATLPASFDPGFLMYVNSPTGRFWIIPGDGEVYVYDFATFTDISNTAGYPGDTSDFWQGAMLGGIPVINNKNHFPEYWAPQSVSTNLEFLPWDASNTWEDVGERATVIKAHKQFLIAMDLFSGGAEIADGVRWSSPADINSVPETWDHLDTTNVAGLTHLGSDGGRIIDGLTLRDAFVIYREKGITVADFIGGQFVFQFRDLDTSTGLLSRNAIVEVNGVHLFIGDGDIFRNDGNVVTSAIHKKIRNKFRSNYNPDTFFRSFAIRNEVTSEAWFCVPSALSEYPDIAYVYNWRDDTWSVRDIPVSISGDYGNQSDPLLTWSDIPTTWDQTTNPWDRRTLSPGQDSIFSVTDTELLRLDNFNTASSESFDSIIERTGIAIEGVSITTTVNRIYPHIVGPGKVNIQLGSQDFPGGPVRWKPSEEFDPATDRSITTRTTGELLSYRITNADDLQWEFAGMVVEYVITGTR